MLTNSGYFHAIDIGYRVGYPKDGSLLDTRQLTIDQVYSKIVPAMIAWTKLLYGRAHEIRRSSA